MPRNERQVFLEFYKKEMSEREKGLNAGKHNRSRR